MHALRIQPVTVIPGAKAQTDRYGKPILGIKEPLKTAGGKFVGSKPVLASQLFTMPAPLGTISHWRSAAARRKANGDMTKANPNDLVQVPVYRGLDARFANQMRAFVRRKQKKSLVARLRSEIAGGLKGMKETVMGKTKE